MARWTFCAAALLRGACLAQNAPAPLHFAWEQPDHPSGIYHVQANATLTVVVDNGSAQPADLSGEILFGSRPNASEKPGKDDFKILSVTPIAPATVPPRQRVKIPLKLTFAAAGSYTLRWKPSAPGDTPATPIDSATGISLQCIFAPRTLKSATETAPAGDDSPWLTMLPPAAVRTTGFLADFVQQTTVSRFLIEERFAYDTATNVGLGFGASTGAGVKELDTFFAEAAKAAPVPTAKIGGQKPRFVLRLTVPATAGDAKSVSALKEYIADAIRRSKGTLAAIAIVPGTPPADADPPTDALRHNFATLYLAAYEAAKKADHNILLLGAGSAALTAQWLAKDPKLMSYIDALAITDAAADPPLARQLLANRNPPAKTPLYLLPPPPGAGTIWPPPAAALAQGASVVAVPAPEVDHGVTAHLLGGAVLLERVQLSVPSAGAPQTSRVPFIAVFQGDGYSVAAIAGFSAGTDLDAAFPALARTRTVVEPADKNAADPTAAADQPAYPNLQVSDDTRSMRVVDAGGAPVDCRVGDNIFVPAGNSVVYLLQGGTAEDLAGSLHPATANFLPLFEPTLLEKPDGAWSLRLRNCGTRETGGSVRLVQPPANPADPLVVLAEKEFPPISPEKTVELPLPANANTRATAPVIIEITTAGNKPLIQRTALTTK